MRSLCLVVLLCYVALSIAQPATVLELISGNADFQVQYRANELPKWFLNGHVYYILGSLPCEFGQNPIWNGTDWYCGNFTGFPSGTSLFDKLNCQTGQNIAYNGTAYVCSQDSDVLQSLKCSQNGIPVKLGAVFVCGTDSDILANLVCSEGEYLVSNGTAFNCAVQTDHDTLRDLHCQEGQTAKFNGTHWVCGNDLDTFNLLQCLAGEVAKYQNGSFICGIDEDLLPTLGCQVGQTVVGNDPTSFSCADQPLPPGVPISFIDGQALQPTNTPSTLDTFFGSPQGRQHNTFQLINGFLVFALSFNFNVLPRAAAGDAGFMFNVTIYKKFGLSSYPVFNIDYPVGATSTSVLTSLNIPFNSSEQMYVTYTYEKLLVERGLSVTTVLFVRHFVF